MIRSPMIYLSFDLGAGSGRALIGRLADGSLVTQEINRFKNSPVRLGGRIYWDFLWLWKNILNSMRLCAERGYRQLAGIGIDTWGVDFGLLDADNALLRNPLCYRDSLANRAPRAIGRAIDKRVLFNLTGVPPTPISTLSQLVAEKNLLNAGLLKTSKTLLMMPDLFRYFLSGRKSAELTAAGTSQLLNMRNNRWSGKILRTMRIPKRILPEIVQPGQAVGRLLPELATYTSLNTAPVIAVAGHDTASAGAAVPFADNDHAFLSCGTWSVLGVIQDQVNTSEAALSHGFTNVKGFESTLFVKNGMGLYLFENLARALAKDDSNPLYDELLRKASSTKAFGHFLDVNSPYFFSADDPRAHIDEFLTETGQAATKRIGEIVRALLEGLAWSCRKSTDELAKLTGRKLKKLSIVGGGSKNSMLCQMVADATGLEVIAGPAEASAAGNLSLQALATGQLKNAEDIRELIKRSFRLEIYKPKTTKLWDKNYPQYLKTLRKSTSLK